MNLFDPDKIHEILQPRPNTEDEKQQAVKAILGRGELTTQQQAAMLDMLDLTATAGDMLRRARDE